MLRRLFARFRRRPRDYAPRHSVVVPVPAPPRRMPPPPPPPPPPPASEPGTQVLPARAASAEGGVPPTGYPAGDARVSFVLRDGSVANPELDAETSSRMDYLVRTLLDNEPVRRTT